MKRVVQDVCADLWAFLFPSESFRDQTQPKYRPRPYWTWLVAGIGSPALGWIAGSFLGSWGPRTACATAATALALGWLSRRPGAALIGAACAAIVSLAAVRIGETHFSGVVAWPLAGLVIGIIDVFVLRRLRARIAFIVAAPLLACAGFLAGITVTMLTAFALSDSRVSAQLMLGGAVGFGFLLMAGAAIAARLLDAVRAAGGAS